MSESNTEEEATRTLQDLMDEGRLGSIVMNLSDMKSVPFDGLLSLQSVMVVTDIIHNFAEKRVIFTGFSEQFRETAAGERTPVYLTSFNMETQEITVEEMKVDADETPQSEDK